MALLEAHPVAPLRALLVGPRTSRRRAEMQRAASRAAWVALLRGFLSLRAWHIGGTEKVADSGRVHGVVASCNTRTVLESRSVVICATTCEMTSLPTATRKQIGSLRNTINHKMVFLFAFVDRLLDDNKYKTTKDALAVARVETA